VIVMSKAKPDRRASARPDAMFLMIPGVE